MNEYSRAPDLYRYHGITYTYDELRKAHRKQQLTIQSAIDSGDYDAACKYANLDTREFLPQIEQPKPKPKRKSKLLRILCRLLK